ncbi:HD-GYP domain-containing protein [Maridesulfovibrio sp.]|uniref:HD-GYP domain-containing protein n=1 Tax=Maridesulfovibrio sp. TaxID=2795000 RepID=UPI002A18BEB2|nr:HD-GYP domain-containing protein [Maridesulfovibrio sp.]
MLEKIKTANLQEGMYIVCSAIGSPSLPQELANNFISSKEDLATIARLHIHEVLIDSEKTKRRDSFPHTSHSEEILFAREAYRNALKSIQKMYDTIQRKAPLEIDIYAKDVDPLLDSIERNSSSAASLTVLAQTDRYILTHSLNTAILSAILGRHLGLSRETTKELSIAALLMNVGQIWIRQELFQKNGKLNATEFAQIKSHPKCGYDYLSTQPGISDKIISAVLQHHEKYDGSGYPGGLSSNDISQYARIITICDSYDAMTTDRPYREALTPNAAIKHLYNMANTAFHPRYLENFIKCIGIYPAGCFVRLSDGRYAVVVENTPQAPLLPKVKIVFSSHLKAITPEFVNLAKPSEKRLEIVECIHPKTFRLELERFLW